MNIYLNFFIGSCLASHAKLIHDRFRTESSILGHSYCKNCNGILSITDLIPILSYLFLKGKCRYCHSRISISYFLVEIIGGFLFTNCDFSNLLGLGQTLFLFFFLLISIFDFYSKEFPTFLLCPLLVLTPFNFQFNLIDFCFLCLPLLILMMIFCRFKLIGSGDILIYIIVCFNIGIIQTNYILLLANLLAILFFILSQEKYCFKNSIPFIPFLLISFCLFNL